MSEITDLIAELQRDESDEAMQNLMTEVSTALGDIVGLMEKNSKVALTPQKMVEILAAALGKLQIKLEQASPTINVQPAQIAVMPAPNVHNHVSVQPAETVVQVIERDSNVGSVHRVEFKYGIVGGIGGMPISAIITREK